MVLHKDPRDVHGTSSILPNSFYSNHQDLKNNCDQQGGGGNAYYSSALDSSDLYQLEKPNFPPSGRLFYMTYVFPHNRLS